MNDKNNIVDNALGQIRSRRWDGPAHNPLIEHKIKEMKMNRKNVHLSRSAVIGIIAGVFLGGGALAAGVAHYNTVRAVLVADDGTVYEVELATDGGSGVVELDDGTTVLLGSEIEGDLIELTAEVSFEGEGEHTLELSVPAQATSGDSGG